MSDIHEIFNMIENFEHEEKNNRKKLQEAKILFDEEKKRIQENFKNETKHVVVQIQNKLEEKQTLNELLSDKEFTRFMLPCMDALSMGNQFQDIVRRDLTDSYHLELLTMQDCALSLYQSLDDGKERMGLFDSVNQEAIIKKWLSAGDNYSFMINIFGENGAIDSNFDIQFDNETDLWSIGEIECYISEKEDYITPAVPNEKFPNYTSLLSFIDINFISNVLK